MEEKDYYRTLNVPKNASAEEIKKAYRQMALKYHPDRNAGNKEAEDNFKEAAEAYEVLSDEQKRKLYDQYGIAGLKGTNFHGFNSYEDVFSSFGDIFEDLFGFGSSNGRGGRTRGSDLRSEVSLTFKEAVQGEKKEVDVEHYILCPECKGSRAKKGTSPVKCVTCGGSGQVYHSQGFFSISTTCPACRGEGEKIKEYCPKCKGQGRVPESRKVKITIPPGVESGMRLRLRGEGEMGQKGGPSGDLYIDLNVAPHPFLVRHNDDLVVNVSISFAQAALGTVVKVPTLEGAEVVKIKPGTQTDTLLRIKGEGVVKSGMGFGKGDLIVRVIVRTPKDLNKEQKELLKKLDEASPEEDFEIIQNDNTSQKTQKKKSFFF